MNRRVLHPVTGMVAFGACLAALAFASSALATTYPPGPNGCCPDTLTIINLRNPDATPHPVEGDVVLGVGGIITAFTQRVGSFGFYMQMSNGLPFSGVGVFTGNIASGTNPLANLQVGDSVVVYGKVQHINTAANTFGSSSAATFDSFADGEEILVPLDVPVGDAVAEAQAEGRVFVRVVSHGNPEPPTHVGTLAELEQSPTNSDARQWRGMLVRVPGPLESQPGRSGDAYSFSAVNPACSAAVCDTVLVDGGFLTQVPAPSPGTALSLIQGIFDLRGGSFRVQLRGPADVVTGNPPLAFDAFPIFDNDLSGSNRRDSIMVVFDRPVEKTSAENTAHYSLSSLGAIDGAYRLEAPQDNRVVLQIRNGRNDGDPEGITVSGVKSLIDGTSMLGPQTFAFFNGVLEIKKVQAPEPAALAGDACEDRSPYSGPGATPGGRASFSGTVTGAFGDFYTLQGTSPVRSGLWVHAPSLVLTPGHQYLLAGALEEVSGETQATGIGYARDLGVGPALDPAAHSVRILTDDTCDFGQLFLTGDDLDGMLVTIDRVVVIGSQPAGSDFIVAIPGTVTPAAALSSGAALLNTGPQGQILVASLGGNFNFAAVSGQIVSITGVLGRVSGAYAIFPRSESDIIDFGPVPTFSRPLDASKAATASRNPDIVRGVNGELFMVWGRTFHESVHSLSLDNSLNWSVATGIMHQGIQPAVAVTPSNKFCVLGATTDALLFKQSTDGGFQMDPLVTTVDATPTRFPALAVGSGEHLHAAWERPGTGIFYSRSLTGGADFSPPVAIALNGVAPETNSLVRICASTSDNVHVFWQYDLPGEPSVNQVRYRRSLDGGVTFSDARRVRDESNPLSSVVKLAFLGDAGVGPDGSVYVMGLQEGGPADSIAFLRSTNNGATFKLVGHLPNPAPTGLCPKSFVVGPDGTIHAVVAICGTALYYTRSADGGMTWTPLSDISSTSSSQVGEPRGTKIILDGTGTPVIVWFAPVGGSTEIYSSKLLN